MSIAGNMLPDKSADIIYIKLIGTFIVLIYT